MEIWISDNPNFASSTAEARTLGQKNGIRAFRVNCALGAGALFSVGLLSALV